MPRETGGIDDTKNHVILGRLIDRVDVGAGAQDVYGYSCGHDACENLVIFNTRLIDQVVIDGQTYSVYGFFSQCCPESSEVTSSSDFIHRDIVQPFGVSRVLQAQFCSGWNCDSAHEKDVDLHLEDPPDGRIWTGSLGMQGGTLTIRLELKLDGVWELSLGGCAEGAPDLPPECKAPLVLNPSSVCDWPLKLVFDLSIYGVESATGSLQYCCGYCAGYMTLIIKGFCIPVVDARQIDKDINGQMTFGYVDCCLGDCTKAYTCCGENPPAVATRHFLTVNCADGSFVIVPMDPFTPPVPVPPPPCISTFKICPSWAADPPSVWCSGEEVPLSLAISCNLSQNKWQLTIRYSGVTLILDAEQVSCNPFRLVFAGGTYVFTP